MRKTNAVKWKKKVVSILEFTCFRIGAYEEKGNVITRIKIKPITFGLR